MDYEGRGLSSDIFSAVGVRAIVFLYELPLVHSVCASLRRKSG